MSQERIDNLFASESWTAVYTAFSNVSLKAYDFDTIREALINYVSETYPDKFNDFIASSEFIAVLDLVAYLGHSLSFRLDMNTRENFMDTAERRESILRMAKTLGYIKTRPVNARGFMKITSISTDQPIFDNEGNSLANRTINWNDSNNVDWYENFIDVINAALSPNSKIQDPMASMVLAGVENYLYEINERPTSRTVAYGFQSAVAGSNKRFEAVRTEFVDDKIQEAQPIASAKFTIVNRNDNLGPASDRTGFFVYTKVGNLKFEDFSYNSRISNRVDVVADANISNSDVWIQKTDTSGNYFSDVTVVDNDTRETAIYNSLRNGSGDIASVTTLTDNSIQINYPDGVFGNAAYGNYRVWYRTSPNENFTVNRDDVQDGTISIPYVGVDGRNYRLTMSLVSTRDFSENFAAESFTSVRRIAPRAYYAQDRMVNAQDYNVLPLSLGTNIVSKVKAVNTTYAGNSRYFEMDDVTGHHSNASVTGNDCSVYITDDEVKMNLRFNKQNGNADDFIRNEITKALAHPSLVNKFYFENYLKNKKDADDSVVIDLGDPTDASNETIYFQRVPQNPKILEITSAGLDNSSNPHLPYALYPGDFVKIVGDSGVEYWTRITKATSGGGLSNDKFEVADILPETDGNVVTIVRGYRTRFESNEIQTIKTESVENLTVNTFGIVYKKDPILPDTWYWDTVEKDVNGNLNSPAENEIQLEFEYNAGFRDSEAEYIVKFTGKKIVFESHDDVKFYYGNKDVVVDNETNLAERDSILINYLHKNISASTGSDGDETIKVTLGYRPIENYVVDGAGANFDITFPEVTGAPATYNSFTSNSDYFEELRDTIEYTFVSPENAEPDATAYVTDTTITPIGESPNYTVSFNVPDLNAITGTGDLIKENGSTVNSKEYKLSDTALSVAIDNAASAASETTTLTITDIQDFKGKVSPDYLNDARTLNKFFFINSSVIEGDINDIVNGDLGTNDNFISTFDSDTNEYDFVIQPDSEVWKIGDDIVTYPGVDDDVRWKQIAYKQVTFNYSSTLTINDIDVFAPTQIDTDHLELLNQGTVGDGIQYTLLFWTYNPYDNDITIRLKSTEGVTDLNGWYIRTDEQFKLKVNTQKEEHIYKNVHTYVCDEYVEYVESNGYVDNSKLKLLHMDSNNNPFGLIEMFDTHVLNDTNVHGWVALEKNSNNTNFVRVSKDKVVGTAAELKEKLQKDINIKYWFEVTQDTENSSVYDNLQGSWYKRDTSNITIEDTRAETRNNNNWKALWMQTDKPEDFVDFVRGKTYVEDEFMSFRWDHFADIDKRIDPSTSNIIDVYVLGSDYVRRINEWVEDGFGANIPTSPNNFELRKMMESIEDKVAIADHVSYIPVKFKMLFGEFAKPENQAVFKVVKKLGTAYTDSEIKTVVAEAVNEYFALENWNFGEQFYFSELAAYLHSKLGNYISSVVITPKFSGNEFTNLLSISSEPNEIFLSVVTSSDVKIISSLTNELTGE